MFQNLIKKLIHIYNFFKKFFYYYRFDKKYKRSEIKNNITNRTIYTVSEELYRYKYSSSKKNNKLIYKLTFLKKNIEVYDLFFAYKYIYDFISFIKGDNIKLQIIVLYRYKTNLDFNKEDVIKCSDPFFMANFDSKKYYLYIIQWFETIFINDSVNSNISIECIELHLFYFEDKEKQYIQNIKNTLQYLKR